MPIYEFKCNKCNEIKEVIKYIRKESDRTEKCTCGGKALIIMSTPAMGQVK